MCIASPWRGCSPAWLLQTGAGPAGRHPYRVSEPPGLVLPDAWEASGSCGGGGRTSDPGSAQAVGRPGGFSAPQLLGKGAPCNASRRLAREVPACFRFLVAAAATRAAHKSESPAREPGRPSGQARQATPPRGRGERKRKRQAEAKGWAEEGGEERGFFFPPLPNKCFHWSASQGGEAEPEAAEAKVANRSAARDR